MKTEEQELFKEFEAFRKLNISSILPNLTQGEFAVLKAIQCCHTMHPEEYSSYNSENELGEPAENSNIKYAYDKHAKLSDMIAHMHVLAPSVSRSLKNLEERGLIVRMVDKKDRRNICVALTKEGSEKLAEAESILEDFRNTVFGTMGTDNIKRLTRYLHELQNVMAKEIKERKYKEVKDKNEKNI